MENRALDRANDLSDLDGDRIHHVYPTFGRKHITSGRPADRCWCQPNVEFGEGGAIIIHEVEQ